jgi:putative endonuclease
MNENLNTHQKGDLGEELAAQHLLKEGYTIICRKFRSKAGEIDCIARDADGVLVFIEVKSCRNFSYGNPLYWITPSKQRTLARVALQYLSEHQSLGVPCRFDVISIVGSKIDHLKNAFLVK